MRHPRVYAPRPHAIGLFAALKRLGLDIKALSTKMAARYPENDRYWKELQIYDRIKGYRVGRRKLPLVTALILHWLGREADPDFPGLETFFERQIGKEMEKKS